MSISVFEFIHLELAELKRLFFYREFVFRQEYIHSPKTELNQINRRNQNCLGVTQLEKLLDRKLTTLMIVSDSQGTYFITRSLTCTNVQTLS